MDVLSFDFKSNRNEKFIYINDDVGHARQKWPGETSDGCVEPWYEKVMLIFIHWSKWCSYEYGKVRMETHKQLMYLLQHDVCNCTYTPKQIYTVLHRSMKVKKMNKIIPLFGYSFLLIYFDPKLEIGNAWSSLWLKIDSKFIAWNYFIWMSLAYS